MNLLTIALGALMAALAGDVRRVDRVELANGVKLEGRVVYEDEAKIVLREGTRFRELERKDVKSFVSRAASAREAIERWLELEDDDPHALLDLVRFCQRVELDQDAAMFARAALALNPRNAEVHELLGHEKRSDVWHVRDGARWVAFDKLRDLRASWKSGWELESSHYRLRTNLDMSNAVSTLLDLECFYQAFFALLGRELTLYEATEPMGAHVHATRDSFPERLSQQPAYFDAASENLMVDASSGGDRGLVFHEAVHQLLHATAQRKRGSAGPIAGWLDEGLAEYMRAGMSGLPGRPRFVAGLIASQHVALHADASDPYSLARLLTFDSLDFQAPSGVDLKYAQSYTLVHFCLHAQGEKYRRRFFDVLRAALSGRSSPTFFKETMGEDEATLEKAWTEHVRMLRGAR